MRKIFIFTLLALCAQPDARACTNFIVTRGASADGSVMVTYSADSHQLYGALYFHPAADHAPGTTLDIYEWDTGKYMGKIPQVAHTYQTVGNMNEHQLVIAESTWGGRPELRDSTGVMDYGSLIYIALQRARTAREAIGVIVDLANTYGYASDGESFSIADPNEAWIFEMTGKGCRIVNGRNVDRGGVWVARRIPDGYVCGHANQARITQFPWDDPENCLFSPDVAEFARRQGYFTGRTATEFSFADAYSPLNYVQMRGCEARVWSFFNRVAGGMDAYVDYALGHNPANRMPLWVKPSMPLKVKQVMGLMRDHYEETPLDMRHDIGAGGHNKPYRWRPMTFEVDGATYMNERATATQQTGFWFVSQSRRALPAPVGGVLWFGVDDAGTSALVPVYCGVRAVPECLREGNGDMMTWSPTSAFWLFNRVSNFAYLRYDRISADILRVIDQWENDRIADVARWDAEAMLYAGDPGKMHSFLTEKTVQTAQALFDRWTELDRYLLVKYIDGNVKRELREGGFETNGHSPSIPAMPEFPGYNDTWKEAVAGSMGDRLKVPAAKE